MRLFYGCVLFSAESAIEARPLSAGPQLRQRCRVVDCCRYSSIMLKWTWNDFVVCCGAARACVCATWNSLVCIEQCSWYIFVVFSSSESVLDRSEASVSTWLTTWVDLPSSVCQDDRSGPSSLRETSEPGGVVLEGWQKFWEQPPESKESFIACGRKETKHHTPLCYKVCLVHMSLSKTVFWWEVSSPVYQLSIWSIPETECACM